jgi:hypothetical protein
MRKQILPSTPFIRACVLACVPIALALSLAWRASARLADSAPSLARHRAAALQPKPAQVPEPAAIRVDALPMPICWTCPGGARESDAAQLVDLDVIAPLGDGAGNAAEWLASFANGESRAAEGREARSRRVPAVIGGEAARVLPPDDPLLKEAEPWMDQATCRFHPEIWPMDSPRPREPNLLLALTFAKSWVARGDASVDAAAAARDDRRAIRLGRLLLQDDVSIAQDLVGRACIRLGAEALHRSARQSGDLPLALATALVLAEHDGMRAVTAERTSVLQGITPDGANLLGKARVAASDDDVDAVIALARDAVERRFRIAALPVMRLVVDAGTKEQAARARAALSALESDADPLVADAARATTASSPSTERGEP